MFVRDAQEDIGKRRMGWNKWERPGCVSEGRMGGSCKDAVLTVAKSRARARLVAGIGGTKTISLHVIHLFYSFFPVFFGDI